MRFKLDENILIDLADMFRVAAHDAVTILDQNLGGIIGSDLASVCMQEGRTIVIFGTDFADIRTYPPNSYPGIIVFRPSTQSRGHIMGIGARLINTLRDSTLAGQLWIVEDSCIRVRQ